MGFLNLFGAKPAARLGLALGGGGAKGISHLTFLKVLDEMGIRPNVISGTSMGALIGAFYASGLRGADIEKIFRELKPVDIIKLVDFSLGAKYGLVKGEKIIKFLEKLIPAKNFEELQIPLKIVATDFWSREEIIFERGSLMHAIRASVSLPGIFEPVLHDGRVLIDGGTVNSLPYEILRKDCDVLAAINVLGEIAPKTQGAVKPTLIEALLYTFQIMESANLENKLRRSTPDIYVSPRLLNIQLMDFHKIGAILASVADDAVQFRKQLEQFPALLVPAGNNP